MTHEWEDALAHALRERAGKAQPQRPDPDTTIRPRAHALRRRRKTNRTLAVALSATFITLLTMVVISRPDMTVTVVEPSTSVAPAAPMGTGPPSENFHHFISDEAVLPVLDGVPADPIRGPQGSVGRYRDAGIETERAESGVGPPRQYRVFPYATGTGGSDEYLHPLDGETWTVTRSVFDLPWVRKTGVTAASDKLQAFYQATVTAVAGQRFDPARLKFVSATNAGQPLADRLADPSTRPAGLTIHEIGGRTFVTLPPTCENAFNGERMAPMCRTAVIGGDDRALIIIEVVAPPEQYDAQRAAESLRWSDAETWATAQRPPNYLVLPLYNEVSRNPREDVWPDELPGDFCGVWREWSEIQTTSVDSFGGIGWLRRVDRLAELADPADAADWRLMASETRAGRNVSILEPGSSAFYRQIQTPFDRCDFSSVRK